MMEDMNQGKVELRNEKGNICFFSEYIQDKGWIYSCWTGEISDEIVKKGGLINLQMIERFKTCYILNDNRHLTGSWSESNDWIENEYIPQAIALGLKYIAHVFSPKFITKFSAVDLGTRDLPLVFKTFDSISEAEFWLQKMKDSDEVNG